MPVLHLIFEFACPQSGRVGAEQARWKQMFALALSCFCCIDFKGSRNSFSLSFASLLVQVPALLIEHRQIAQK